MNKTLAVRVVALAVVLGGCSSTRIYNDQPLVAKVKPGMSKEQVERIGGKPLAESDRTAVLGTCYDYTLAQAGKKQAYNVSFDEAGKVDHTSFQSCDQWSRAQIKAREPDHSPGGAMGGLGGMGTSGGGY